MFLSFILGSFATSANFLINFSSNFIFLIWAFHLLKNGRERSLSIPRTAKLPPRLSFQVQTTKGWRKCIQFSCVGLIYPWESNVINCPFVYPQRKLSHEKIFFRRKSTGNGTRTKQRTSNATRAGFLLRQIDNCWPLFWNLVWYVIVG